MGFTKQEAKAAIMAPDSGVHDSEKAALLRFTESLEDNALASSLVNAADGNSLIADYLKDAKKAHAGQAEPSASGAAVAAGGGALGAGPVAGAAVEKLLQKINRDQQKINRDQQNINRDQQKIYENQVHLNLKRFLPAPSSNGSKKYRDNCLNAYDPPALRQDENKLLCVALGKSYEKSLVKAAHIYQQKWDRDDLNAVHVHVHSTSNVIPLHKTVEEALDRFRITIIPDVGDVFKLKVLDPSLLVGQQAFVVEGTKWGDLDGKNLTLITSVRPSAWVCAFHANLAVIRATNLGEWIAPGSYKLPRFARKILQTRSPHQLQLFFAHMSDSGSGGGSGSDANPSTENMDGASENEEDAGLAI